MKIKNICALLCLLSMHLGIEAGKGDKKRATEAAKASAAAQPTPPTEAVKVEPIPKVTTPDASPIAPSDVKPEQKLTVAAVPAESTVASSPTSDDTEDEDALVPMMRSSKRFVEDQLPPASSPAVTPTTAMPLQQTVADRQLPVTPRLSAEDIRSLEAAQKTAAQLQKEQAEEEKKLTKTRLEGWDTAADDEPTSTKRLLAPKGWLECFSQLPQQWWADHVTDKNRIEQFMRFAGMVNTYTILRQKLQEGVFRLFIDGLNENAGEGNRWVDEALLQAVADEQEGTTRAIMTAAIPYKQALPPATRKQVAAFLIKRAEQKRKVLAIEHEDFANDMHDIASTIRQATEDAPETPEIPVDILERCAVETALTLTKCATGGYLPRPPAITDRK